MGPALRESSFPIDLAANPELVDGWLSCGVGSRIVRSNPPAQYGGGPLDTLVEGWTETIGPRSWMVQVTPSPAAPWRVGVWNGSTTRYDTNGSQLDQAATATATTLRVRTTSGPTWTTNPAALPLDLSVGGERVRVTAIGTASGGVQTMTVTRAINGVTKAHAAGAVVRLWQPVSYAL